MDGFDGTKSIFAKNCITFGILQKTNFIILFFYKDVCKSVQKYEKEMPLLPTHTAADYAHKVVAKNNAAQLHSWLALQNISHSLQDSSARLMVPSSYIC